MTPMHSFRRDTGWFLASVAILIIITLATSGCSSDESISGPDSSDGGEPVSGFPFVVSSENYSINDDLDQVIKDEFGDDYRLADWTDIEDWARWTGSIGEWVDELGWHDVPSTSLAISRNGQRWYGGGRHYFAALHEGHVPGSFLVHDHIEDHHISLGSWTTPRRYVLGIRD